MNTSDVLNRAADLIEERGWTTGGNGWPGMAGDGAPLCLEGGMMAALGLKFDGNGDAELEGCPAYAAVQSYLNVRCDLWAWNDRVAESGAQVVEVLRAAAVIEAARENAEVSV